MTVDVKECSYFKIKMNLTPELMQKLTEGTPLNAAKELEVGIVKIEIIPPKIEEVTKDKLEKAEVVNVNSEY